ncbi:MAG: hypothetical protein JKY65_06195 [Planctomycetes bacterium]|nr:hypothetical protein [Planctomycetota bacterium]
MKSEVKAALLFALVALTVLLVFWVSDRRPPPSPSVSPLGQLDPPEALTPGEASGPTPPAASPTSPIHTLEASTLPTPPKRGVATRTQQSKTLERAIAAEASLEGTVVGPGGGPVATKVYVFEVVPSLSAVSDYGGQTPPEVEAVARWISRNRGDLLAVTSSDEAGHFSFSHEGLDRLEVVLVAAAEEGVGVLRRRFGGQDPVLVLEARHSLRVAVVTQRDLAGASLQLEIGRARAIPFPALDLQGATRLELPSHLSSGGVLRLEQPGWFSLTRDLGRTELAGGQVTWPVPVDLFGLRGRVQGPGGAPWVGGKVELSCQAEPLGDKWNRLWISTDSEGAFLGRGFPPAQPVKLRIAGSRKHAYYVTKTVAGGPPLRIQLLAPSVLRIRVKRFEGDVDAIETHWKLQRREGERWKDIDPLLYGRAHRGWPGSPESDSLERRFGLRIGRNEILGLPPGRYRVSLVGFGGNQANPVEVELPPGGSAVCVLG